MKFDDLQSQWQSHDHSQPLNIAMDLLLKEVRNSHRQFESVLFRRDAVEVTIGICLFLVFGLVGIKRADWAWLLLAFTCLGVASFFVIDRFIQRARRPDNSGTLEASIQASQFTVRHQIWLLKNIIWWYMLPIVMGWSIVVFRDMWRHPLEDAGWHLFMRIYVGLCCAFFVFVYWLNQNAVKKQLEPRIKELQQMQVQLENLRQSEADG